MFLAVFGSEAVLPSCVLGYGLLGGAGVLELSACSELRFQHKITPLLQDQPKKS